jgi:hypothetical protein
MAERQVKRLGGMQVLVYRGVMGEGQKEGRRCNLEWKGGGTSYGQHVMRLRSDLRNLMRIGL